MDPHQPPSPEQIQTDIFETIDLIVPAFEATHNRQVNPAEVKNSVITGYDEPVVVSRLADMGVEVQGGIGEACTFPLPNKAETLEQVIWFDHNSPSLRNLGNFTKAPIGTLMVTEEVSHYLYNRNYFQSYGELPETWMAELIATIDKYNVSQYLYQKEGVPMDSRTENSLRQTIFAASSLRSRTSIGRLTPDEDHIIGHTLGEQIVNRLNAYYSKGDVDTANKLLSKIYNSDKQSLDRLLQTLGIGG